jgi:hypothetical protein
MGKAGEKQKRTPKTKDKQEYERFVETARKLGCDESEDALKRAFEKIAPQKMKSNKIDVPHKNDSGPHGDGNN